MSVRVIHGTVSEILISDPRTRNALSTAVLLDIAAAVDELSADERTRVIVLAGDGGTFSSGGNIKEDVPVETVISATVKVFEAIDEALKPVVARVEGHCLGLAVGIMAACDLAIVARETRFALPEPHLGQAPTMAAYSVVPRLRPADASRLLLTAEAFDGDFACNIGLANASVPAAELDREQKRWTDQLVRGGPAALAACKKLVRTTVALGRAEALALASDLTRKLAGSPEALEGKEAFQQRRPPAWATPDTTE